MGKFYCLAVYNALRKLYESLKTNTSKMPRDDRYTHVIPLMKVVESVMADIAFANDSEPKSVFLEPAIEKVERLQITVRNLFELHLITEKGFSRLSENSEAVLRQLKGWNNKHSKKSVQGIPESK